MPEGRRALVVLVALFVVAFLATYFALLQMDTGFRALTRLLWDPRVISALFGSGVFLVGMGAVMIIPGRHGEEGDIALGTAMVFVGSMLLTMSLALISLYARG